MIKYFLLFTITFFSFATPSFCIEVGVAETDITPPEGVYLWGYSNRTAPSEGTIDPLKAKAVIFDDGERLAAIITLDLGRVLPEAEMEQLQSQLKNKYKLSQALITASHTHSAPSFEQKRINQGWLSELIPKIVGLVGDAIANKQNAVFKTATGLADLSYDRRLIHEDGTVEMLWSNFERNLVRPIDQKVRTIFIEDQSGNPIVTMVHYACHPVMTGQDNLLVSADFPAYLAEVVEKEIGGTCVFIQGAAGNINPYMAAILSEDPENGLSTIKEEGYSLGNCVVALHQQARKVEDQNFQIRATNLENEFKARYDWQDERIQSIVQHLYLKNPDQETVKVGISMLTLGDQFAWAGFPGEFFDEFQVDLIQRSPFPHTYFVGYCNGHFTYFPTIEAAAQGGYGADRRTLTQVGAGEELVNQAVIGLFRLSGKMEGN